MKDLQTKTVNVRHFCKDFTDSLCNKAPQEIEKLYRRGDYLYIGEAAFKMVEYSMATTSNKQQSRYVSYWSPLFDLQIDFDFETSDTDIFCPVVDWESMGR